MIEWLISITWLQKVIISAKNIQASLSLWVKLKKNSSFGAICFYFKHCTITKCNTTLCDYICKTLENLTLLQCNNVDKILKLNFF